MPCRRRWYSSRGTSSAIFLELLSEENNDQSLKEDVNGCSSLTVDREEMREWDPEHGADPKLSEDVVEEV